MGCRKKITGLIDQLYATYRIKFNYPAEFVKWPLPPMIDLTSYNAHAFAEYQNSAQQCPRCLRTYPLIGMANHLSECNVDPKTVQAQPQRQNPTATAKLQQSIKPQKTEPGKPQTIESLGVPTQLPVQKMQSGKQYVEEIAPAGPDNRVQCERCQRMFDPSRIDAHERICSKVKFEPVHRGEKDDRDPVEKLMERNQKGFDVTRYASMAGDTGIGGGLIGMKQKPKDTQKTTLGQTKVAKEQKKVPENMLPDGRIMCVNCGRGFGQDRIQKHQEVCVNLQNVKFSSPGAKQLSNTTSQYGVKGAPGFQLKSTQGLQQQTLKPPKEDSMRYNEEVEKLPPKPQIKKVQDMKEQVKAPSQSGPSVNLKSASQSSVKSVSDKPVAKQFGATMQGAKVAKFCHECGEKYNDAAKFCHECGTKRMQ